jgi:hypothetical protein
MTAKIGACNGPFDGPNDILKRLVQHKLIFARAIAQNATSKALQSGQGTPLCFILQLGLTRTADESSESLQKTPE